MVDSTIPTSVGAGVGAAAAGAASSPLTLATVIASFLNETMKFLNEKQRTKIMEEHHDILKDLKESENASYPHYYNSRIDLGNERLRIFLDAYWAELRKAGVGTL